MSQYIPSLKLCDTSFYSKEMNSEKTINFLHSITYPGPFNAPVSAGSLLCYFFFFTKPRNASMYRRTQQAPLSPFEGA